MKRFTTGLILAFSLSTFLTIPISNAAVLGSKVLYTAATTDGLVAKHGVSTAIPIETAEAIKATKTAELNTIVARIKEIKSIDKSTLTSLEKKELKKETRALKSHYKDISGGVYLSGGAIIIIVVLLILLL